MAFACKWPRKEREAFIALENDGKPFADSYSLPAGALFATAHWHGEGLSWDSGEGEPKTCLINMCRVLA